MIENIKRTNYYKDGELMINVLDFGTHKKWTNFDDKGNVLDSSEEVCMAIAKDCDQKVESLVGGGNQTHFGFTITNLKNNSVESQNILCSLEDED